MRTGLKVSVCIPCYNSEKFIAKTIQSVLNSTYKNFDLIIIDNCSKDNTVNIVKGFQKRYKNIFLYKNKKNIGMFPNMNRCIDLARGKYLKIVCSDDLLYPECLEKEVLAFEDNKNVVLVYGASDIITNSGKHIFTRKFFKKDRKMNGGVLINQILLSGRNPLGEPTGIMIKTDILKKFKLHFINSFRYVSDLDLWIKILQHGNGYYCHSVLTAFRLHSGQGTNTLFKKALNEHIMLSLKYSDEYGLQLFDTFFIYIKLLFFYYAKIVIMFFTKVER